MGGPGRRSFPSAAGYDDVPAEQHAADHLPGVPGRVVRADGNGLGHTWDCRRMALARLPDTPDPQTPL